MKAEAKFASALSRVDTASVDEQLTLSGDVVEMVFERLEPMPEAELMDIHWVLDGLIQGETVWSPAPGAPDPWRGGLSFVSGA